ncbi:hypothetical protein AB0C81_18335 [Streptomyces roseoverticillatus]|uniref:hypothetical protein n=1 Tax=Streptomyces roseoverticillatus TaxID=66429 RepID=UPI0033E0B942
MKDTTVGLSRLVRLSVITVAAGALCVPLSLSAATAEAAQAPMAGVPLITCKGTTTTTFNPGLTDTAKEVTRSSTTDYTGCTGTSATAKGKTTWPAAQLSCTSPNAGPGTGVVTWGDGTTSTLTSDGSQVQRHTDGKITVVEVGRITAGEHVGSHYTKTLSRAGLDQAACASTEGVKSSSGDATLTINPNTS